MYIFIDESGQLSKRSSGSYFVVGSFVVGNPRRTEKQFMGWFHTRFPKKLRHLSEVKFSSKIDDKLRLRTLKCISEMDVRIRYSFLKCSNIPFEYWSKGRLRSGDLYVNVVGETVEQYLPSDDLELRVFCDLRHLKGMKKGDFESRIKARLLPLMPKGAILQVEMIDSISNANIQIADWITGALAWYKEGKPLGVECFDILRNNILGNGKDLFREA